TLCFALGLMSKPMLVTLPVVLLLLDVWPLGRLSSAASDRTAAIIALAIEKAPLFILAVAVAIATFIVQSQVGAVGTLEQLPLSFRLSNGLVSYARYIGQMLWPTGLAVFYPYPPTLPPVWQILGAAVIV